MQMQDRESVDTILQSTEELGAALPGSESAAGALGHGHGVMQQHRSVRRMQEASLKPTPIIPQITPARELLRKEGDTASFLDHDVTMTCKKRASTYRTSKISLCRSDFDRTFFVSKTTTHRSEHINQKRSQRLLSSILS